MAAAEPASTRIPKPAKPQAKPAKPKPAKPKPQAKPAKLKPQAKPAKLKPQAKPKPANEVLYDVEAIVGERLNKEGKREYLIKWDGYGYDETTWEPKEDYADLKGLVAAWEQEKKVDV